MSGANRVHQLCVDGWTTKVEGSAHPGRDYLRCTLMAASTSSLRRVIDKMTAMNAFGMSEALSQYER